VRKHPAWAASLGITLILGAGFLLWSARLAAAGKRRTTLAIRFATDAKDLENRIGVERLHPPHDLRPVVARITEGLERIQKDIAHLGPEARGPGNLALGRGYLTMRFLEPALQALEEAWDGGYRTPDTAYALCKVHCEFFIRILDQEQLGDIPPAPDLAAYHLRAAREFYALSAGATWEPPELCLAKLLIFERRGAEALEVARKLHAGNPWFYEAKVEEAYAHEALGYDLQLAGDGQRALASYRQAEAAALEAQAIGRSDVTCYLASLDWRLHWLENPHLAPTEALAMWKEAEDLVDIALTIRPGSPRGISAKVHVILGRARLLKALGRDPRPDLVRAEHYLWSAPPTPSFQWLIPLKRDLVRRTREELGRLS